MIERIAVRIPGLSLAMAGIVALSAGCDDVTGSSAPFEPHRTLDRLDEVLAPFEDSGDFLLGLDLTVATLEQFGAARLAEAIDLRLDREGRLLRSLRRGHRPTPAPPDEVASIEGGTAAFTVPWTVLGETLVWDRTQGYVVSGRSGAPPNGVRILLYRMNGDTGYPITPLSQIGHLDLLEDDRSNEEGVRVRAIRTTGPDRVIGDYRVSLTGFGSYDEGGMVVTTRGALGEVTPVELELYQRLEWSRSRNRDELTLDYDYRLGSTSLDLEVDAESRYEAVEWETLQFGVAVRGGRVVTDLDADIRSDGSLRGEIRNSGRRVVQIGGYDGRPTFESASGRVLSRSDRSTLERIWIGITDILWLTDWVVVPADLLLASG